MVLLISFINTLRNISVELYRWMLSPADFPLYWLIFFLVVAAVCLVCCIILLFLPSTLKPESKKKLSNIAWWLFFLGFCLLILMAWIAYPGIVEYELQQRGDLSFEKAAQSGDMFGGLNTLFSGLAFAGVIVTMILQRKSQEEQARQFREEMQKAELRTQYDSISRLLEQTDKLFSKGEEYIKGRKDIKWDKTKTFHRYFMRQLRKLVRQLAGSTEKKSEMEEEIYNAYQEVHTVLLFLYPWAARIKIWQQRIAQLDIEDTHKTELNEELSSIMGPDNRLLLSACYAKLEHITWKKKEDRKEASDEVMSFPSLNDLATIIPSAMDKVNTDEVLYILVNILSFSTYLSIKQSSTPKTELMKQIHQLRTKYAAPSEESATPPVA